MNINYKTEVGLLTILPEGEIDHHCALQMVGEIGRIIDDMASPKVRLDFASVPFMDSSGIAVVMGAYKGARGLGSGFEMANVSAQPMKVLKAAGIEKIIPFI